ncbi:hypothetical protein, partial [Marivita sp.]|uniref:hypothetical protein n=1 Tax=Marivita sp. TaxID=2003365 RepID=UPI00321A7807
FQANDAGSIPAARSKIFPKFCCRLSLYWTLSRQIGICGAFGLTIAGRPMFKRVQQKTGT